MRKQSHLFRKVLKTAMGVFLAGLLLWTAVYGFGNGDGRKQEQQPQMSGAVTSELRGPELKAPDSAGRSIMRTDQASPTR